MRELWLGDRVDFDGEYYHTKSPQGRRVPLSPRSAMADMGLAAAPPLLRRLATE